MADNRLLKECSKYLSSEGIYYRIDENSILACINGQFVRFEFDEKPIPGKMLASGGLLHHPRTLEGFIKTVKDLETMVGGNYGIKR